MARGGSFFSVGMSSPADWTEPVPANKMVKTASIRRMGDPFRRLGSNGLNLVDGKWYKLDWGIFEERSEDLMSMSSEEEADAFHILKCDILSSTSSCRPLQ